LERRVEGRSELLNLLILEASEGGRGKRGMRRMTFGE
jgi:hypothetical protein